MPLFALFIARICCRGCQVTCSTLFWTALSHFKRPIWPQTKLNTHKTSFSCPPFFVLSLTDAEASKTTIQKLLIGWLKKLKRKEEVWKESKHFFILTIPNFSVPSCLIKWFRENRIRLQQRRAAKRKAQQQLGGEGNDVDDGGNDCGQTSLTLHSTASTTLQRCAHNIATHCP